MRFDRRTAPIVATYGLAVAIVAAVLWVIVVRQFPRDSLAAAAIVAIVGFVGGFILARILHGAVVPRWLNPSRLEYAIARDTFGAVVTIAAIIAAIVGDGLMPVIVIAAAWLGARASLKQQERDAPAAVTVRV